MEISLNSSEIEIIFRDEREDEVFSPEKALEVFINKNIERFLLPLIPKVENGKTPIKGVDYNDGYTPIKDKDYFDGVTPVKGIDYFTKKEVSEIKKTLKEAILAEMPKTLSEEQINIKLENIIKRIEKIPKGGGGALFLRQLMDVNVGNPEAKQYGLTYNPSRSEFALTEISVSSAFTDLTDTFPSYTGLGGKGLRVKSTEDGIDTYIPTDTDEKVKISANDTTAKYQEDSLESGTGIDIQTINEGGNEKSQITNTAPDQTVSITDSGIATVTGTYPNFNVDVPAETDPIFTAWLAGSPLSGYVPYTGATTDLDLNAKSFKNFFISKTADVTAKMVFDVGALSTATIRTLTVPNRSFTLDNINTSTTTTGTGFLKGNGTSISFDNSTYLTSVTPHNLLSTTHGDTTAGSVARGDLVTGQGATPKWTRLAKGTANQFLRMDATGTDVTWSTFTASPGGLDTQIQFNDSGSFGGDSKFTYNKTTGVLTNLGQIVSKYDGGGSSTISQILWDTNVNGNPEYQLWLNASYYGGFGHTLSEMYLFEISYGHIWQFNRNQGNMGFGIQADYTTTYLPCAFAFAPSVANRELQDSWIGNSGLTGGLNLHGLADFWASSYITSAGTDDRVRIGIGNANPTISGSRSVALHFWSYNDDPFYGGTFPVSKWEMGTDYLKQNDQSFYLWDSVGGNRQFYIRIKDNSSMVYLGQGAGNEQGDNNYGASLCAGTKSGWNKNTSGNNTLYGHYTGGDQTNGSYLSAFGFGAGGGIDGDYNSCFGHYCASAGGEYSYSTHGLYVGNYINAGFGIYRVIIDSSGGAHSTYLKSSRHSLMFGTCAPSTPRTQTLYLNANVSIMGLNSVCDRDSGDAIFCRNTGEQLFKPTV